jgi:hypothetical protein
MFDKKHALLRINPKGEEFVGRCIFCHKEGFKLKDVEDCPMAPNDPERTDKIISDIF